MFRFENPHALIWLWLIPFFVLISLAFARYAQRKIGGQLGDRLVPFLTRSVSLRKRRMKLALQSLTLALIVIAMARPQLGQSKQEVRSEGFEIMLMVDVSESMMTEDVKPNRLEQAKVDLARLIDMMPGNKTGVIAFAGSAAVLSPLTVDPAAVKMYLDSLSTNSVSSQGTCFECALTTAEDAFEWGGASADEAAKVSRVILVASDGEDHEPGALEKAKQLAAKGVRIYTMAYGTEKGGSIPVRDNMGYLRGYKKDHTGQTILSQVKGDVLKELAEAGQGTMTFATGGDQIKDLVARLEKLEKAQFETQVATQYDERFQWVLLPAIVLALIELLLGERRGTFRIWKGRFEVPPA